MFPGDSEGMQILEMAQIKGNPTEDEFARLSKLCEIPVLQLLQRNEDCYEIDLAKLMMSNSKSSYIQSDIEKAADLIKKCLRWVPEDRITAKDARLHPFFI
jgi:serine/threonine protein kinase